ncbi:C10 family peptidase [uncultured Bacteroides sp.]|uniref:C10 family peptidase n=1 Tax=uncultured Bacteroides sp. TaxID=162156 RepID=UPI0025EC6168|nr:C10 family peptidase [uncultured Bacteroides sp.]
MKQILFVLCSLLPGLLFADNVTVGQAQSLAVNFFKASAQTRGASPRLQLVWNGEEAGTRTSGEPAFYVFDRTDQEGFVIVSGEDVTLPVLAYSFENKFKAEDMPVNLKEWLAELRRQINDVRKKNVTTSTETAQSWANVSASIGTVEKKLATAKWDQINPYNKYCPYINSQRAVTGCVATALAIVMRYHQWPDKGIGTLPDYSYEYRNVQWNQPGHSLGHTYNWNNMPLTPYKGDWTAQELDNVARLIFDCGVMSKATYSPESTGAITKEAVQGLLYYMSYGKGAKFLQREWYSDTEWIRMLKQEIATNGPILYNGRTSDNEGHLFVLDGYTNKEYFSVNWGWSGSCDGYYLISALNPATPGTGGGYEFNYYQSAVFNLKKEDGSSRYENLLVLGAGATEDGTQYNGLATTETDFQQGKNFIVSACFFFNRGFNVFNGEVILSLVDRNGVWKEDVSSTLTFMNLKVNSGIGRSSILCRITQPLVAGDRIWLRYRSTDPDSPSAWQRMLAYEGVVSEIIVKEPGIDEVTSLSYNKKDKVILLKTISGVAYKLTLGTAQKISGKTTDAKPEIRIDTSTLAAGTYKLILEKGTDKKELNFVIGNQK